MNPNSTEPGRWAVGFKTRGWPFPHGGVVWFDTQIQASAWLEHWQAQVVMLWWDIGPGVEFGPFGFEAFYGGEGDGEAEEIVYS